MYQFPKTTVKIKERIKRYERELQKEEKKFGFISDGYGKRYLLGPLYVLMGDIEGAIKSYNWFEGEFSDDIGEPFHSLCWVFALYRSGDKTKASRKLLEMMLSNLYIIPYILGIEQDELDIWHGSNLVMKEYMEYLPPVLVDLWDKQALDWIRDEYQRPEFQKIRSRYIEIYGQLKTEKPGPKRSQLVQEAHYLEKTRLE
ncbi:MAG: hypothetical protein ABIG63_13245 [Chloroflexota bacterium]